MKLKLKAAGQLSPFMQTVKRFLVFEDRDGNELKTVWYAGKASLLTRSDVGVDIEVDDKYVTFGDDGWFKISTKKIKKKGQAAIPSDTHISGFVENIKVKVIKNKLFDPWNNSPTKKEVHKYNWVLKVRVDSKDCVTFLQNRREVSEMLNLPIHYLPDVEYEKGEWKKKFRIIDAISAWLVYEKKAKVQIIGNPKGKELIIRNINFEVNSEGIERLVNKIENRMIDNKMLVVPGFYRILQTDKEYIEANVSDINKYKGVRKLFVDAFGEPTTEKLVDSPPLEVLKKSGPKAEAIYFVKEVEDIKVIIYEELRYGVGTKIAVSCGNEIISLKTIKHNKNREKEFKEVRNWIKKKTWL